MRFLKNIFLDLFRTQESLSDGDHQKSVKMVTVDGIASMGMGTLQGGVFLTAFAIAIGASNYEIGLLATIGFFSQLMQLPGLFLVQKFKKRRAITFFCASFSRILWTFIILIPVLFVSKGITFLLQWLIMAMLVGNLAGPSWNSLLRDVIPANWMGKAMAKRMMLGTILALTLTLAGGYFVDWWKAAFPSVGLYSYSILFSMGLGMGLVGVFAISRISEPTMEAGDSSSILELIVKPVKDRNFRSLLWFIGFWTFSVNLAGPFFIVYMLKRIGVSVFTVTLLTVTSQVTNILFLRIWGKLADRFSNKSVLAVAGPMFLLVILGWTFTTMPEKYFLTIPLLFLIHALSGMSLAGVSLSSANIALKLSPMGLAHAYMTVFAMVTAVCGSVAPLLGGMMADFFAARELSLAINWSEPARQLSIYALNFKALDFLFFFAFLVGLYSLHRLALVKEEGEVEEKEVIDQLKDEVALPLKTVVSIEGLRRMTLMPMNALNKIRNGIGL